MINNNNNNKIHSLNFISGILLFITCIYGFIDIKDNFHFTNFIVNIYTIFASIGVIFVQIAGFKEQNPPGVLEYFMEHELQLKFLFLYSWLTIGVSFTSQVLSILVLIYSFFALIYDKLWGLNTITINNNTNNTNLPIGMSNVV